VSRIYRLEALKTFITEPLKGEVFPLDFIALGGLGSDDDFAFEADGFAAGPALKMRMLIMVGVGSAIGKAQGIPANAPTVCRQVDQPLVLKGFEGAVKGDAVRVVELRLEFLIRKCFPFRSHEKLKDLLSKSGLP
jgi:hypothetical protein